ncbi:MAG TPA: sugar ABC transporter ATP-binding protein [Solirubrobacterales bacterium]|nr:sugar ABC transporter ATP-binding protein [Solirubrobacterales bacterium]
MDAPVVLEATGLSKSFGMNRALNDVSLAVRAGEVHAIVGQNGCGKSTLVKVLSGFHAVDSDAEAVVRIADRPVHLHDPHASWLAGLRFVHQDLGVVGTLNTTENLGLGRGYRTGFAGRIKWTQAHREARERLADLGYDIDPRLPVGALRPAERTGVAVARAIQNLDQVKALVIDEPTASLPREEVKILFEAIERVRARGIGIVYVSHHLDEVFDLCDRVTVMRDGGKVGTYATADLDVDGLIRLMVGDAVSHTEHTFAGGDESPAVLTARGLRGLVVDGVDLDVRAGEILGIAGLTGSGREELLSMTFGASPRAGLVEVEGAAIAPESPRSAMAAGIGFVPPDRHALGAIFELTVQENCGLTDLRRHSGRLGALRRSEERKEVDYWLDSLDVRPRQPGAPIAALSGGNQQKVVLAKWLRMSPRVLLLDEPTQGVDVGAKAAIHDFVRRAATDRSAILVASGDERELCELCDRIIVLRDGRVSLELQRGSISPEHIARAQI